MKRCDSSVSHLSWLHHKSVQHHITCLDTLCFPYADDSTATTPTVDVIFGGGAPYYAAVRRSSSRSFVVRQAAQPPPSTRPGFTFVRNRREPTHFQWFGAPTPTSKPASQLFQLPPNAPSRLVSRSARPHVLLMFFWRETGVR